MPTRSKNSDTVPLRIRRLFVSEAEQIATRYLKNAGLPANPHLIRESIEYYTLYLVILGVPSGASERIFTRYANLARKMYMIDELREHLRKCR